MGKVKPKKRRIKVKQSKRRRMKLLKLQHRYLGVKSREEKEAIEEKIKKIQPHINKII